VKTLNYQHSIGWPEQAKQTTPKIIRGYWSIKDYIGIEDGILVMGHRLVIPKSMQSEYLQRIHAGHQGITKCQLRAKESLYWPNMSSDIENMVRDCMACLSNARSQPKEPMIAHEIPSMPWETLSSDLFDLDGHTYILLVDHYSKMPFVRYLTKQTSGEVIKFMRDIFSVHGVPKILYTDNGPQ